MAGGGGGINSRNIFTGNAGNNSETTCRNFRIENYFRFSKRKPLKQIAKEYSAYYIQRRCLLYHQSVWGSHLSPAISSFIMKVTTLYFCLRFLQT